MTLFPWETRPSKPSSKPYGDYHEQLKRDHILRVLETDENGRASRIQLGDAWTPDHLCAVAGVPVGSQLSFTIENDQPIRHQLTQVNPNGGKIYDIAIEQRPRETLVLLTVVTAPVKGR